MISVITAAVTGGCLIIVQIIISIKQQRTHDTKTDMLIEEIKKDIGRLEGKQDRHNKLIERMAVVERDQKTIFRYIDEFREKIG